jgi:transposase
METSSWELCSLPITSSSAEGQMLQEDKVREVLARLERGEGIKAIARDLGIDRKTVKRWRKLGGWRAQRRQRARQIDPFAQFVRRRGEEVGWNAVVVYRELCSLGFSGSYQQVRRFMKPFRAERRWAQLATVRFETGPGEQAQVDFGETQLWIAEKIERVYLFVFTLGYSRRLFCHAYADERLSSLIDGHERAFGHFGGVPLTCLYDNPRTMVLGRHGGKVLWHPVFEDFTRYYGFTPHACQPYRARTKGKVERGIKYVKRNALAGRRFFSWEQLNEWLLDWCVTVADVRIHGTTHERPIERFGAEKLTPIGKRPPYRYERVMIRQVPSDALVSIESSRYSVPVNYVGETVTVHQSANHYEIFHRDTLVFRHQKAPRHSVVMVPEHYAGLLRAKSVVGSPKPPRWDPAYLRLGEVAVRDLSVYESLSGQGGER